MPLLAYLAIGAAAVFGYVWYRSSNELRTGSHYYIAIDVSGMGQALQGAPGLAALMVASKTWTPLVIYGVPPAPAISQPPPNAPKGLLSAWGTGHYAIAAATWNGPDKSDPKKAGAGVVVFGKAA